MSKISDLKEKCGYQERPLAQICANCKNYSSEKRLEKWMEEANERGRHKYTVEINGVEKNLRCSIHGFKIKKTATCEIWEKK